MLRRTWIAVTGVALLSGPASHADDTANTVIGVNPRLSEGAYALEFGNYDEGIRLTLEGLRSSVRPSDRVGALSNLCAGYVGLQEYDSALRYCNRALRIDEKNWHAYNNRSLAYLGLGNTAALNHSAWTVLTATQGTLVRTGTAHGPASVASTVALGSASGAGSAGVLQFVTPTAITSNVGMPADMMTTLTLRLVPEPGMLLLIASGVGGLVALGRVRMRNK